MPEDFKTDEEILASDGDIEAPTGQDLDDWWGEDDEGEGASNSDRTALGTNNPNEPPPEIEYPEGEEEEAEEDDDAEEEMQDDDEEESEGDESEEEDDESEEEVDEDSEDEEDAEEDESDGMEEDGEEESDEEEEDEEAEDDDEDSSKEVSTRSLIKSIGSDRIKETSPSADARAEEVAKKMKEEYLNGFTIETPDSISEEFQAIRVPDVDFKIGDSTFNLAKMEKEAPDLTSAIKLYMLHVGKHLVNAQVNPLRSQLNNEVTISEVSQYHPDARRILNSPEFNDWFNKQDEETQAGILGDSGDIALGITLFLEDSNASVTPKPTSKKKAKKKKAEKKTVRTKKKKLLRGNVNGKKRSVKREAYDKFDQSPAALDAAWDEDDD